MSDALRDIVIWDLDSTLADTRPRRHLCPTVDPDRTWTDYAMACAEDRPIVAAVTLNRMLYDAGCTQHILSWRSHRAHALTMDWLFRHRVLYDVLRLRLPSDPDDSTAFKVDYIQRLTRIGVTPTLVVEDWPATATAIEAIGVPVLCFNPRYGEGQ